MWRTVSLIVLTLPIGAAADDLKELQGNWKITAVIQDGNSLSEKEIATEYVADGKLKIEGLTVMLLSPGTFETRKMIFVLKTDTNPKGIDLVGAQKVGSQGIYMLSGDDLILCIGTPGETQRPAGFSAEKGSGRVMISLQRMQGGVTLKAPVPIAPPVLKWDDTAREQLIGTWGHQDDEAVFYYTFNADGTFSAVTEWKRKLKQVFNGSIRSSGTWKVVDNVLIAHITASSDPKLRGQVVSHRITHLGEKSLITTDSVGKSHNQWRVK